MQNRNIRSWFFSKIQKWGLLCDLFTSQAFRLLVWSGCDGNVKGAERLIAKSETPTSLFIQRTMLDVLPNISNFKYSKIPQNRFMISCRFPLCISDPSSWKLRLRSEPNLKTIALLHRRRCRLRKKIRKEYLMVVNGRFWQQIQWWNYEKKSTGIQRQETF